MHSVNKRVFRIPIQLLILFFILLCFCVLIVLFFIPKAIVTWDEAAYIWDAYTIARIIAGGSLNELITLPWGFLNHSLSLNELVLGFPLLFTSFSFIKLRVIGLVWFVLASCLIYVLAKAVAPTKKVMHMLALVMFVISPMILVLSSVLYREMAGAVIAMVVSISYLRLRDEKWYLLYKTSFWLILLTIIKNNYGILMTAIIIVDLIVNAASIKSWRNGFLRIIAIFLPFYLVLCGLIAVTSTNIVVFLNVLRNPFPLTNGFTSFWQYLWFYPHEILFAYSPSFILGLFYVIVPFVTLFYLKKNRTLRLIWIIFFLTFISVLLHYRVMMARFLFTGIPFLFILSAYIVDEIVMWVLQQKRRVKLLSGCFLLVVVGFIIRDLGSLVTYTYAVGAYTFQCALFNQLDFRDDWSIRSPKYWSKIISQSGDEKPEDVIEYIADLVDLSKQYSIIGQSLELSPFLQNLILSERRRRGDYPLRAYKSYLVKMEISPGSKYYSRDYILFHKPELDEFSKLKDNKPYVMLQHRYFHQLMVGVEVYASL